MGFCPFTWAFGGADGQEQWKVPWVTWEARAALALGESCKHTLLPSFIWGEWTEHEAWKSSTGAWDNPLVFITALLGCKNWEGRGWGAGKSSHTGQRRATTLGAESLPVLAWECPEGLHLPQESLSLRKGDGGSHDDLQP